MTASQRPSSEGFVLRRRLGAFTTTLVGIGVAVGSGILRTPPVVASHVDGLVAMLAIWTLGGLFMLASSLVMAELATRFPASGGEYVWLKEAYGPEIAAFFGWGYTVFIVAGGAATIAAAFGEATSQFLGGQAQLWAVAAIVGVVALNAVGIGVGAGLQNALTLLKLAILLCGVLLCLTADSSSAGVSSKSDGKWLLAILPVIWAYSGSTDAVKLSGEIKDPNRTIPKALLYALGSIAVLYLGVVSALYWALGSQLSQANLPLSEVAYQTLGSSGTGMTAGTAVIFLAGLSSTLFATSRVTWALGQDGFSPGFLGAMSRSQAPVGALLGIGVIAILFCFSRSFEQILQIYFLGASVLFGLVYSSLFVFRKRPHEGPYFRCPAAGLLVTVLIGMQTAMAVNILVDRPWDGVYALGAFAILGAAVRLRSHLGSSL